MENVFILYFIFFFSIQIICLFGLQFISYWSFEYNLNFPSIKNLSKHFFFFYFFSSLFFSSFSCVLTKLFNTGKTWDLTRTAKMASLGLFITGPLMHVWYKFLNKAVTGNTNLDIAKKIFLDQAIFGPTIVSGKQTNKSEKWSKNLKEMKKDINNFLILIFFCVFFF